MIGTKLDPNWVRAKREMLKNRSFDKHGKHRDQCLCSSNGLVDQTTICPRHNTQIRTARNPQRK